MGFWDADHDGMVRDGEEIAEKNRRKSEELQRRIDDYHRVRRSRPQRKALIRFGDAAFDAIGVGPSNKIVARRNRRK